MGFIRGAVCSSIGIDGEGAIPPLPPSLPQLSPDSRRIGASAATAEGDSHQGDNHASNENTDRNRIEFLVALGWTLPKIASAAQSEYESMPGLSRMGIRPSGDDIEKMNANLSSSILNPEGPVHHGDPERARGRVQGLRYGWNRKPQAISSSAGSSPRP